MELAFKGQRVDGGENATVQMTSGDYLSISFKGVDGTDQVINVNVQGKVGVVHHEQTGEHLVIRK